MTGAKIPVEAFHEIDSTSLEASRRAAAGSRGPVWLRADTQTAGRGRMGREWVSDPGNVYATLLMPIADDPSAAALHSFVACLAVADTLDAFADVPERVSLKWPNDVLMDDRKIAGVLLESGMNPAGRWLSIGIGLNLKTVPKQTRLPATSLSEATGTMAPTPDDALSVLSKAMKARIAAFDAEGFAPLRAAWLARAARLGETVEARLPRETLTGRFENLDGDGAMLLHTETGRHRIVAADVHFP